MADIQSIYNRLHADTAFTPVSAETFGDWSLEAGDVVTAVKDGTAYRTPVMQSKLRWNGGGTVTIESTGNKEREAISRQAKRDYGGKSGGYYGAKKQQYINLAFEDDLGSMRSELYMSYASLHLAFESEISNTRNAIDVQANRISVVVEGTGANAKVKPAVIEASITDNNGYLSSNIKLSADNVFIDGNTTVNDVLYVFNGSAYVAKPMIVGDGTLQSSVFIDGGSVDANQINVLGGTNNYTTLNVANVQIDENDDTKLIISYVDGTSVTFSKAVTPTITSGWDGGTYTVKAGNTAVATTTLQSLSGAGDVWRSGYWVSRNFTVMEGPDINHVETTGAVLTASINAESVYTAGAQSCWLFAGGADGDIQGRLGFDTNYRIGYPSNEPSHYVPHAVWRTPPNYGADAWLFLPSDVSGYENRGELGYSTAVSPGYQHAGEPAVVRPFYWTTPPDRFDAGKQAGKTECLNSIHHFNVVGTAAADVNPYGVQFWNINVLNDAGEVIKYVPGVWALDASTGLIALGQDIEVQSGRNDSTVTVNGFVNSITVRAVEPETHTNGSAQLYCSKITTGQTGIKTVTLTVQYGASQNVPFTEGRSRQVYW